MNWASFKIFWSTSFLSKNPQESNIWLEKKKFYVNWGHVSWQLEKCVYDYSLENLKRLEMVRSFFIITNELVNRWVLKNLYQCKSDIELCNTLSFLPICYQRQLWIRRSSVVLDFSYLETNLIPLTYGITILVGFSLPNVFTEYVIQPVSSKMMRMEYMTLIKIRS